MSRPQEDGNPTPTTFAYDPDGSWPDVERDHAGAITYLDARIGELVAYLDAHYPDTLVLFASDNGARAASRRPRARPRRPTAGAHNEGGHVHAFFNSTGGLRGFKRSLYEGGVRSPSVARWPGTVKPGWSDHEWLFSDFLATAAELAGVSDAPATDGLSIVPELLGEQQPTHDFLYWTWVGDGFSPKHGVMGYAALRGDYKIVYKNCTTGSPRATDPVELYHLPSDPFETADVAAARADVVDEIRGALVAADLSCCCYQC